MPKCILSEQVKSTFTQEQADGRYIQMTNGATTTLASSLQVSGINNIEFTEEGEDPITASNVSYSNTTSGMTSGNVQNAIDELFQSVSEGKSLIAAAVTDKGVETAATDSFATMAGNIGQISGGGSGNESFEWFEIPLSSANTKSAPSTRAGGGITTYYSGSISLKKTPFCVCFWPFDGNIILGDINETYYLNSSQGWGVDRGSRAVNRFEISSVSVSGTLMSFQVGIDSMFGYTKVYALAIYDGPFETA